MLRMQLIGASALVAAMNEFAMAFEVGGAYVVYTNVEYAAYQEYGTVYQPGTPHFRPAIESVSASFGSYIANAGSLDEGLNRAAQEIAATAARMAPVDTGNLRASYTVQVA